MPKSRDVRPVSFNDWVLAESRCVTLKYFGVFRREMPILSQHCCLANTVNTLFSRNLWDTLFCHFVFVPRNDCLRFAVVWHKCTCGAAAARERRDANLQLGPRCCDGPRLILHCS
ncbi:hypothetical protein IscW_ISCW020015 [Ixodes scapularis]|uniref:Uncharacterized protein n=1 Tax=Ixodes scapularis TaxID=6945 RepID=B7Q232_IXOSC|nr:hypothetical protein IscW_ISCW020015 [Ixodes scapularis]|eukprot:XP_002410391.1 hypothetical protein IscW_ISCW020015 [Ixodes scapularis]